MRVTFRGSAQGLWEIESQRAVAGEDLPAAARLAMIEGEQHVDAQAAWELHGSTGAARYTNRRETDALLATQQGLGRDDALCGAFIAVRKNPSWWAMAQDERRAIFEEQSRHIAIGMQALPAVARRLHHSRELGEPFDFLTWFEFAPSAGDVFDGMLAELRASREWTFVDREVDIRVRRLAS